MITYVQGMIATAPQLEDYFRTYPFAQGRIAIAIYHCATKEALEAAGAITKALMERKDLRIERYRYTRDLFLLPQGTDVPAHLSKERKPEFSSLEERARHWNRTLGWEKGALADEAQYYAGLPEGTLAYHLYLAEPSLLATMYRQRLGMEPALPVGEIAIVHGPKKQYLVSTGPLLASRPQTT